MGFREEGLGLIKKLGGSWVVISGNKSHLICVIRLVTLLITLLITTHEPPSNHLIKIISIYKYG